MNSTITNKDRKYLGLTIIKENWIERKLSKDIKIYIDGNTIVKVIEERIDFYWEATFCESLSEDGVWLLPKTSKGKRVKLTSSTISRRNPIGTYFCWCQSIIIIGNYTNQRTFYDSYLNNTKIFSSDELRGWIDDWVSNTTDDLQSDLDNFCALPRKRIRIKEGDYFSIKYDRNLYGFGRVLLDVERLRKDNIEKFSPFMGKPILIKQFIYLSESKNIDISKLDKCKMFPSLYIMDNYLFYGDYEIFAHKDLCDTDMDYPILYHRSNSTKDLNKINLIIGDIYKQIEKSNNVFYGNFGQWGIGFITNIDVKILKECIDKNSLEPYWKSNKFNNKRNKDLRNPQLSEMRNNILTQFEIENYNVFSNF